MFDVTAVDDVVVVGGHVLQESTGEARSRVGIQIDRLGLFESRAFAADRARAS